MEKETNKKVYVIRYGEVALKGMNRPYFERMLMDRIRRKLRGVKGVKINREEGLLVIRTGEDVEEKFLIDTVSKIFGVDSISPVKEVESELSAIEEAAVSYAGDIVKALADSREKAGDTSSPITFKVEAKRGDKSFPMESPELARHIGACILKSFGSSNEGDFENERLKVDVHNPDFKITVHVKRVNTFIYEKRVSGFGGLPLGTNGKGLVLFSGGIDSPVAAFLMAKRGMYIEAVHFHSYPFTSQRAYEKVRDLVQELSVYCGNITIHSVNLLEIQEAIGEKCPEEELTLHTRRFMMKIAEKIAKESGALVLITGENLGQVASQTAEALVVTDEATSMPVMRPLIGMDKTEIIKLAKDIGTYDISIQPFEDCCTVFLPKHPKTKPKIEEIKKSESLLDVDGLIEKVLDKKETEKISQVPGK